VGKMTVKEERARMDEENDALMSELDSFSADVDTTINRLLDDDKVDGQVFLDVKDIHPNPNQPRKAFDKSKIEELMSSILVNGLVQSLAVMKKDDGYLLIDGERRWRAIKMASELGLKSESFSPRSVPCYLKYHDHHKDSEHLSVHSFVANEMAEKLSPTERALAIHEMMCGEYSYHDLMERTGMSRPMITKYNSIGRWIVSASIEDILCTVSISFIDLYRLATCKERPSDLPADLVCFIEGLDSNKCTEKEIHAWVISRCKGKKRARSTKVKESGVFGSECAWESYIERGTLTLKIKKVDGDMWGRMRSAIESTFCQAGVKDV